MITTTNLCRPATGRLLDEDLFVEQGDELRLAGSACGDCGTVTFPAQGSCPKCAGQTVARVALAELGTLWAFTVQGFPPKTPYLGAAAPFEPYGVGYVNVGGVLVESRLTTADTAVLRVGLPLQLVLEVVPGSEGDQVWTFAFAPVSDERGGVS